MCRKTAFPRQSKGDRRFAVRWLIITWFALACSGCALDSSRKISFDAGPLPPNRAPVLANTITVFPLSDERSTAFEKAPELLVLVPFVPSVSSYWEQPDQGYFMWNEDANEKVADRPAEAVAKGLARALESRKVFQAVVYSPSVGDGHLVLTGKLTSTRLDFKNSAYGLSVAMLPVALLGAPIQFFKWHLAFELELQEPLTKTVLWHNAYRAEHEVTNNNMYYREERSPHYWNSYLLMDLVPTIAGDLEKALTAIKAGATPEAASQSSSK